MTDISGTTTDSWNYDAYGTPSQTNGTTGNAFLFNGQQWDGGEGLYFLRARYYGPSTGRFLSQDPILGLLDNPMSIHRYVYAENAPTNNFDPSGQVNVGDWDNPNQPEDGYSYQPDAFYALIEREVISLYQRDRGIYEAGVVLGGSPHYAENSQLFLPSQLFEGGWQGTLAEMQSLPQRPSPAWYQFYIPDLFDTQNYLFASVKPASQFLKGQSDIGRYTTAYSSPNLRSEGWGFSPLTDWPSRPYVINIGTGTNFTIENRSNSGVIVYYLGPTDEPAPEPCYDWVGDPAVDLCILQAFATRARILGTIRAPVAAGTTVVGGEKSSRSQFSVGLACIFAMFGMF